MKNQSLVFFFFLFSLSLGYANENLKAKGSLRFRHETLLNEGQHSRNRQRVQAKAALTAKVNENFSGKIELASGGATARSANATLDGGFSKKTIAVNQAYIKFVCTMGTGLSLMAGKFKNPFEKVGKSELVWDSDNVPEGASLGWHKTFGGFSPFVNTGFFWVNEVKASADDIYLISGQGGFNLPLSEGAFKITAGTGYHHYNNVKGALLSSVDNGFYGNTTMEISNGELYASDFALLEVFGEFGLKLGKIPSALFGHFVMNLEADADNIGWLTGISLGKVNKPGSLGFRGYYRVQECESVLGLFGDSDFGGGNTGTKGVEASLGLGLMQNVSANATWFINQLGIDNGDMYNRGQFDLKLKF